MGKGIPWGVASGAEREAAAVAAAAAAAAAPDAADVDAAAGDDDEFADDADARVMRPGRSGAPRSGTILQKSIGI